MNFEKLTEHDEISFESLYLDPNNPRLGSNNPPGYDAPEKLFDEVAQKELEDALSKKYEIKKELLLSIKSLGWISEDPIIVWQHPKEKKKYVVVEGNTRTTALRMIRELYQKQLKDIERAKSRKSTPEETISQMEEEAEAYKRVIKQTDKIGVKRILAKKTTDLLQILPGILSVRHISGAKEWTRHARNLYLVKLYRDHHYIKNGNHNIKKLDKEISETVAHTVGVGPIVARRNVQCALMFEDFKAKFEDQLPEGEEFSDQDQQFFEQILMSNFLKGKFEIDNSSVSLDADSAQLLFNGSFRKPRKGGGEDNNNLFPTAKSYNLWTKLQDYDQKQKTSFATQIDLENPDESERITTLWDDKIRHEERARPLQLLRKLVEEVKQLKLEDISAHGTTLKPLIKELYQWSEYAVKKM